MVPLLPSLQTEYAVRRGAGAGHGEKEPSLFLSTHRLSTGQKACGEMAPVKYCDSEFGGQILQKPADDKPSGNWKAEGVNQKSVAILRMRERGIGVAELTLIDFMRELLCLNAMT